MLPSPLHTAARLLVVLCLALFFPAVATAGNGPISEPDELGPWEVGRTTFQVVDPDRDDRALVVDAWYPVDPEDAGGPSSVYDLIFAGIASEVAFDEPPVSAEGPFPMVVFSHGNNGIRFQSYFLTEHLASHGMIVVAPDHSGNTAADLLNPSPPPFQASDRPLDVSLLITRMLQRSIEFTDPFFGSVDPLRIGVAGHSFGGFTTLAMATGFQEIPPDPRVSAIMPISPASSSFSDEDLAEITVPMLVLGGTSDITTPIDPQSVRPFAFASSRPRYRVDVEKAGHGSFTNICEFYVALLPFLPPELLEFLLGNFEEGCAPELIPIEEAHRVTNLYATAFFSRDLVGDPRYERYLTPGRVYKEDLPVQFFVVNGGGSAGGR